MGLATFLFYVTFSTHGFTQINVVPMPNMEVCEQVKAHMVNEIAYERKDPTFGSPETRMSVKAPGLPECKSF